MRFLVFSDLHGRLDRLEEAVRVAGDAVDVLCAGDVLGAGGDNDACVRWLTQRGVPCVRGNHEVDLLPVHGPRLASESLEAIAAWPLEATVGDAFLAHCLVEDPSAPRPGFLEITSEDRARRTADRTDRRLVFVGHTHLPGWWVERDGSWTWHPVYGETEVDLQPACRYVVNVGSLGEPRPPQKPCLVLWTGNRIQFRRLP